MSRLDVANTPVIVHVRLVLVRFLQQENEELKESLEEHQSVLELIMTKYREQMSKLIELKGQQTFAETFYKTNLVQESQNKTDQIAEMASIMRTAIEIDETTVTMNEQRLQMLLAENNGLRELLQIQTKYGLKNNPRVNQDKSVQTTDDLHAADTELSGPGN